MPEGAPVSEAPLLEIADLRIRFPTRRRTIEAVRGIDLTVGREKLGIVGESGSGKSSVGRAILRLLPESAVVTATSMRFQGIDLLAATEPEMRSIRGRRITMIAQDPKFALNPVMAIGAQIAEAYLAHRTASPEEARLKTLAMLEAVRFPDPERVFAAYPHELSGGMGQRAMIAMMVISSPDLLIADEPTSALDATVQMQILAILDDLVQQRGMGLVFISHDIDLVASFCDRVAVMYGGQIVETCAAGALHAARHPYTRGLLAAIPRLDTAVERLPVLVRDKAWLEPLGPR
jgi:peptide/nickel transport system ATP-binding protein